MCQERIYNHEADPSKNTQKNSILTAGSPTSDVKIGYTLDGQVKLRLIEHLLITGGILRQFLKAIEKLTYSLIWVQKTFRRYNESYDPDFQLSKLLFPTLHC